MSLANGVKERTSRERQSGTVTALDKYPFKSKNLINVDGNSWQPQPAVSTHEGEWILPLCPALPLLLSFYPKQHHRLGLPSALGMFSDY